MVSADPGTGIDYSATQPESDPVSQWWVRQATTALGHLGYRVEMRRAEGRRRYRERQVEVDHTERLIIADAVLPPMTTAFNLVAQVAEVRAYIADTEDSAVAATQQTGPAPSTRTTRATTTAPTPG